MDTLRGLLNLAAAKVLRISRPAAQPPYSEHEIFILIIIIIVAITALPRDQWCLSAHLLQMHILYSGCLRFENSPAIRISWEWPFRCLDTYRSTSRLPSFRYFRQPHPSYDLMASPLRLSPKGFPVHCRQFTTGRGRLSIHNHRLHISPPCRIRHRAHRVVKATGVHPLRL